MAGFVYNPAESIKQDFQQAGSAIGNVFAQVIQQQKRDYDLAENTFANIEALKKDLNIYGQKSITSKANALLGNASSAILANGKIDYSKMGEIRQAISDIKDLKTGYDLGTKEYERMLQMGVANKDNLTSFEGFYKDLSAKMSDENLVKNPRDLQAAFADTYTMNLDATKMFGKSIIASNPYQKFSQDVRDPKTGAMMRLQGELLADWSLDTQGNKIPPKPITVTNPDGTVTTVDYADRYLAQLKSSNPEALAAMKRQAGFSGLSEKQLVEYYTSKIPMTSQAQQIKSAEQISREKDLAAQEAFQTSKQEEKYNLERQLTLSAIAENKAQRSKALSEMGGGKTAPITFSLSNYGIDVSDKGKSVDFGAEVKISVSDPQNPNVTVPFKATGLRTLPNGQQQIVGYSSTGTINEDTKEIEYGTTRTFYPYKGAGEKSLPMSIKNLGKDKESNISESIYYYNNTSIPRSQRAAAPAAKAAPAVKAAPAMKKNAYSKYSDKALLSDDGRKKGAYSRMTDAQYISFIRSQP
jgi:hypothetical protein